MQKDDKAQAHENDARKSPSNCLAARRGLIRKTSRFRERSIHFEEARRAAHIAGVDTDSSARSDN
jgi:hypothetical protein